MATNFVPVVVPVGVLVVIRFSFSPVFSRPIVRKRFTHIHDDILHQATVADF